MLYITMVMYNKSMSDIMSRDITKRLLEHHGEGKAKIIIVDNSDKNYLVGQDEELRQFVSSSGIAYIRSGENVGLAKAYNKALEHALRESENPKKDFMMFLDDDSDIGYDYLREIYLQAKNPRRDTDGINVITGLISAAGKPLSPVKGYRFMFRDKDYIKTKGVYSDICCINSGMAVRLDSLEKVGGFEESLFLDMIDYTLMYNLSRHDMCKVLVIGERFEQSFSGRYNIDRRHARKRYAIYRKDFMRYCEIVGKPVIYARLNLLKRRFSIEMKYKA